MDGREEMLRIPEVGVDEGGGVRELLSQTDGGGGGKDELVVKKVGKLSNSPPEALLSCLKAQMEIVNGWGDPGLGTG